MNLDIIPKPKKYENYGESIYIEPYYKADCAELEDYMHAFSDITDRIWGICFSPSDNYSVKCIDISSDKSLETGSYRICTNYGECKVFYSDTSSLLCALSTIIKIGKRTCDIKIKLPKCVIEDYPDSKFRALMIDVARKWHPIDYLYKYVDLAFLLNINRLIIHFTDDESYTLPSKSFPQLPTKNRHYEENELRALDFYAFSRGVMIIPEIDMPGHSTQFCLKYPDLFGKHLILDAAEEVFNALERIYQETAELFPNSEYIHIGGDEAIISRWQESERSLNYMKQNGIKDFSTLYAHYIGRMCHFIISIDKTPIVWEGFHKENNSLIPKQTVVIGWESYYQLAPDLANAGFKLLNASWKPLYVLSPWTKWSPEEILNWNKYKWDHWIEKSPAKGGGRVFVDESADVDGGILCAWGDYLKNYESCRLACQLELKCIMPRLSALSARLWSTHEEINQDKFESSYSHIAELLSLMWGENPFRGEFQ